LRSITKLIGSTNTFHIRGFRIVVPERLAGRLPDYGFELLKIRLAPNGTNLLVARRHDEFDDEL
jgi:hypothetical protein